MAKVVAPGLSLGASGKIGGALVFSTWRGRPYLRQLVKPANPRSGGQVSVRSMMRFLSQRWAALTAPEKASWAAIATVDNLPNFNGYIKENMRRWSSVLTPSKDFPITAVGAVGTTPTTVSTGGQRQVQVDVDVVTANDNWGVNIYRSTLTGFATGFVNLVQAMLLDDTNVHTFVDRGLAPDDYFYNYRLFTDDGVVGAELGETTATVT